MHTKLFSRREREVLEAWLSGRPYDHIYLSKVLYRVRSPSRLEEDIRLLARVRRRLKAKPPPAKTA
jgi:hypothetical protein